MYPVKSRFSTVELNTLRRLRAGFLDGSAGLNDYWRSESDLALYDATFAQRIGWKWDAVLRELELRQWQPASEHVLDWGCGTGIASRAFLAAFPGIRSVQFHDRSQEARRFASARLHETFPSVTADLSRPDATDKTVLLSHVLNELPAHALQQLITLLRNAAAVVWVESGTHTTSRLLSEARATLLGAGFEPVAPCPHSGPCPMLDPKNARHWCHHFAQPPPAAFQDARWEQFRRELGIDLRSLPYSFVVLQRPTSPPPTPQAQHPQAERPEETPFRHRLIGKPREFKGHDKVLTCQKEGLTEWMLQKRDAPELLTEMRAPSGVPNYQLLTQNGKILSGTAFCTY